MDAVLDPFEELAELDAHIDFAVSEQCATAPPETLSSVGGDEAAQTVDPVVWDPGQPRRATRSDPDAAPPETLSSVGSDETAQAVDVHVVQEPGGPSPKANPDAAPPKTQSLVGGDEMAKAVDTPAGKGPWKPSSPRADPSPAYQGEGPTKPPLSDHSLFFSNITQWGPQSEKWLAGPGTQYQMVALVETHISPGKAPPIYDKLAADGWGISSTTATPTSRSDGGNTGGEIILSRYHVQATTFNHLRDLAISQRRPDPFHGFTPMVWHRRSGNLVVIAAYLEPRRQIEGAVHDKLLSLGAFVTMLTDPWIILADWNMTPEQLAATEWLAKWNATIVRAPGSATCDKGQGLTLDFALVKTGIEHTISIRQCPTVPWATHVGLEVRAGSADPWWYQSIDAPKSFPIVDRPRIPPDPNSKTAIKKRKTAEARAARLRDLPPELQQAAAQLQPQDEPAAQEPIPYAIPMDLWEKQWQEAVPTRCKQPHAHFAYRHWVHDADVLNLKYAKWVTALENTMISHHQIDPKEAAAYTGRAQGYQLSWKKTAAAPGRVHVHDPHSEWWAITLTLIKRYAALHDKPKHTALMQQQATIIQQRADHFNTHMHDLQFEKDEDTIFRWFALVWAPHLDKDDTYDLVTITATWASRALSAALAKSKRAYGAWLAQQWKHRPGVLHAHVKPAPARRIEAYTANLTIADPTAIMDNKKQQWQQVWQATETSDDILQALSKAKAAAAHQPLEPITAEIDLATSIDYQNQQSKLMQRTKDGYIEEWNLPPADDPDLLDAGIHTVLQDLSEDLHRLLWTQAATHAHGDTLAGGADMVTIRIEQRRFLANGDFSDWALNNTIISGGQWTRDRLHNAGYQIDRNCDRCSAGQAASEVRIRMEISGWEFGISCRIDLAVLWSRGPRVISGKAIHPSHTLATIPKWQMFFCVKCGHTATHQARGPRDPAGQAAQPGSRLPEIPGASGGRARAQEAGAELPPLPAPARVPAAQALPAELQEAPGAPRQPQDPNGGQIEWARQTSGSPASRPGAEAQAVPQQAAPGPPRELPPIQQPLQAAAPPPQPLQQPEQQLHHPPELQHQATQQQQPVHEQAPVQQQQTLRQQQQQPQQHVESRRSQAAAARAGASPDAAREQTPKRASVAAVEDLGPSNMAATRAGSPPPLLVMGRDGRERRSKVSDMPSTMNPQDPRGPRRQVNGRRVNRGAGLGAVAGQLRDRATENAAVGKAKRTKVEDGAGHDAESRLLRRTMIMKIQAAWRQYIRSKKSAKEAEQARHRAATRIQARWRAWIVRHRKRAKAAIAIQRVARGFTLRLKAKRRKAAITIQRHFLGNIERRRLKKLHRAATEIQARFRGTGQRKRYQMLRMKTKHAVEVLHGFYHLIQAKKRFNALLAESNAEAEKQAAAVSIQKVFRAHKSRQSTMELRLKVRGDERHLRAVLTVQAFVRRKAAQRVMQRMRKNKIQELSNAATRIRAHWLKYMHLKRYRELRAEFKTHVPSVLVLQRYARGYLVRMRMWRDAIRAEEELWAAVEIQRCWRGYCGRLKWEMEYETVWSREAAVRRLQRHVRGWLSRTRAHRIRKRRARADFERARRRFKAAQRIQALARGRAGRRRVAELRGRKDQAATTVQRIFRGRRKRIEMRHQVVDRRTTQIQALARGFLVRRRRARFEAKGGHTALTPRLEDHGADLRAALTVRNTFIEFDEAGVEDALREGLWGRQASEPAKLCGRQVSDQTTSASGGAGPGGSDQEDSSQIAQYLASSAFRSQAAALGNFETAALALVLPEAPAAVQGYTPLATPGLCRPTMPAELRARSRSRSRGGGEPPRRSPDAADRGRDADRARDADRRDAERREDRRDGDRRDRDGDRRDRDRRDGDRRDGDRRDGDRREGERREGDRREGERREGDRRDGERRDGDRREGDRRDGERRDGERREGERPRDSDRRERSKERERERSRGRRGRSRERSRERDGEREPGRDKNRDGRDGDWRYRDGARERDRSSDDKGRKEKDRADEKGGKTESGKPEADAATRRRERKSKWGQEAEEPPAAAPAPASGPTALAPLPPGLMKPSMCMLFTQGLCTKGDQCTGAHNLRDLAPGGLKPKLCPSYGQGRCPRGEICIYAHGPHELPPGFKCSMCSNWKKGDCRRQAICPNAHGDEELAFFKKMIQEHALKTAQKATQMLSPHLLQAAQLKLAACGGGQQPGSVASLAAAAALLKAKGGGDPPPMMRPPGEVLALTASADIPKKPSGLPFVPPSAINAPRPHERRSPPKTFQQGQKIAPGHRRPNSSRCLLGSPGRSTGPEGYFLALWKARVRVRALAVWIPGRDPADTRYRTDARSARGLPRESVPHPEGRGPRARPARPRYGYVFAHKRPTGLPFVPPSAINAPRPRRHTKCARWAQTYACAMCASNPQGRCAHRNVAGVFWPDRWAYFKRCVLRVPVENRSPGGA
ncbi:unnamed protein product [Prorocentrum cordatum]|uniref:C3H1-type domain-containing protein n=1 Tax=Prorocentrum cordatum TaxID=2364126 RepID=A0ABN9R0C7_9DINO|nr:unnamed protein product [Polarella glacialis]